MEAGDQDMLAKKPEVKMVLPAAVHHVRLARFRASSRCSDFDVVESAAGVGESVRGTSAECVCCDSRDEHHADSAQLSDITGISPRVAHLRSGFSLTSLPLTAFCGYFVANFSS